MNRPYRSYDGDQRDRAEDGDQEAVHIETGNPTLSQKAHKPSAQYRSYDAKQDVRDQTFAGSHDGRGYPAYDRSENDPNKNAHMFFVI